ncbi:putative oxidoreductase [Sulfuritortus calidifontis]|uniref:Putative oxidoreductase n=1 Tax=Sulfuritortus calidifontis TaxID=1914471 RepID=A0A4R3JVZ3_9PROT|nr:DoxX family protein [Sulfuritortus calidifontis]TCS72182.1 putative oxidoreductase [Sulfuritortus calidifontis]
MAGLIHTVFLLVAALERYGQPLALLGLRLLLAWEFWQAGRGKLRGENWFADIQDAFPFPFNLLPAEWSWQLATWTELIAAALLVLGLATRLGSLALIVLTGVAWASVHAGLGYNVCDNGWKLPLIYLIMLLPLLFGGAGRLSLDHWLRTHLSSCRQC